MNEIFNEDYFERGLESGLSCYSNYRWLHKQTIMACGAIIKFAEIEKEHTLLDFGASKGFYVKGFLELGIESWGWDISKYAVDNCHPDVKDRMTLLDMNQSFPKNRWYDWVLAKDVLEHLAIDKMRIFLKDIPAPRGYFIIPLGLGNRFNDPRNNMDITHKLCMPAWWWGLEILKERWTIIKYAEEVPGLKQAWATKDAYGHFICRRLGETR